jgi:hypothetical protein
MLAKFDSPAVDSGFSSQSNTRLSLGRPLHGIAYETVVQAKDWKNPVKKGQLIEFKGVLDDLPGQPRGVFVTRTGCQRAAKDFAAAHGIILYELGEPAKRPNTQITPLGWLLFKAEFRTFKVPSKNPDEGLIERVGITKGVERLPRSLRCFRTSDPHSRCYRNSAHLGREFALCQEIRKLRDAVY